MARGESNSAVANTHRLPTDSARLQRLKELCETSIDTPQELLYLDTLFAEASRSDNIYYQATAYRNKVRYYFNNDNLEKALAASEPALQFFTTHKMYAELFDVQSMLINLYTNQQKYELSIQKGYKMYEEAEKLNSVDGKIAACNSLSYACYVSKRFAESLKWNQKGIALAKIQKNNQLTLTEFYFIGSECLYEQKQLDASLLYVDSAYIYLHEYCNENAKDFREYFPFYQLWFYCRYAAENIRQKELDSAKNNLEKAEKLLENYQYDTYKDLYYFTWSDYYLATNEYNKSLATLEKGFEYMSQWLPGADPEILKKRSIIHAKMGMLKEATDELALSAQLADSIHYVRLNEQTEHLRSIYEVNRLETERKERIFIIRSLIALVIVLCIVITLLGYLLYRYRKFKYKLAVAVKAAQDADANTSGFLGNLSREVHIFLQELSSLSDELIKDTDQEKRQEHANLICSRNEKAQRVIFDILDVSKIESDRMQFISTPVCLNLLMPEIEGFSQCKTAGNTKIILDACEEITIITDPERLNQILVNIIFYISAHITDGKIHFGYKPENENIRFYVSCKEWTISVQEQNLVFDRLAQTAGKLEEMNLGMIICQGLVTKLGGKLTVTTDLAVGTYIEFTLPNLSPSGTNEK